MKRTPAVLALEAALSLHADLLARFGPGASDAGLAASEVELPAR